MPKQQPPSGSGKPPHPGDLMKRIRRLSAAGKIALSAHTLEQRMGERGIELSDVLEVFAKGEIEGSITPGKRANEWRCLVVGGLPWTSRDAGVVAVVVRDERLIVITVEWMDP